MIRAWPRLTSEIEPKEITKIDKVIRKTNTKANILTALKWARLFGGAGALIVIDGHEHIMHEPLNLEDVEIGAYKGVIPFDRWAGITPSAEVSNDISDPNSFNLPKYYEVQLPSGGSFKVHHSRILRFTGPTVPTPEYEARSEWGVSVIEVCFEEIRKRDNMSWNLLCLSYRANLISMKMPDLAQMLSGASMSQQALVQFQSRMESINAYMNSNNMMLLPENGEMGSVSYSPGGWSELYQQFQMDIAGAVGIPVVKLFGRTATGLAQSNDADLQLYYDKIGQEQDTDLRPQLERLYPIICQSELGEVPKDLDMIFPSARVMGEDEKANLAKNIGDLILGAAAGGVITKAMALRELKQSSDLTGIFTNITDEDIIKAEEEEEAGLGGMGEMGGGMPGQPGAPNPGAGPEGGDPKASGPKGPAPTPQAEVKKEVPKEKTDDSKRWADKLREKLKSTDADSSGIKYVNFAGVMVGIEYDAGERRIFYDDNGEVVYNTLLKYPYGFIQGTTGRDGVEIDVILGSTKQPNDVYIVDMIDLGPNVEARENEDKVMLGFDNAEEAKEAFYSMYPTNFFGGMKKMPIEEFRAAMQRGVL
jgi:phage-related protein (TIGR01555 family)